LYVLNLVAGEAKSRKTAYERASCPFFSLGEEDGKFI